MNELVAQNIHEPVFQIRVIVVQTICHGRGGQATVEPVLARQVNGNTETRFAFVVERKRTCVRSVWEMLKRVRSVWETLKRVRGSSSSTIKKV